MPAYLIAQIRIRDPERYKQYVARTPTVIAQYGGRFLARGGTADFPEGNPEQRRVVLIEFPSLEVARSFYHSAAYQEILQIRTAASEGEIVIVEGVSV